MTFPTARCPFILCDSTVELIVEQAEPGDDESTVQRVRAHTLTPDTWYGYCPASLTLYPTPARDLQEFNSAIFRHKNMRDDRDRRDAERDAVPLAPEPPKKSRPPNTWFRAGSTGDNPKGDQGPKGFRRLLPGFLPGTTEQRGGAVASVAEVRAAISQAQQMLAEGQELARQAGGKMAEGEALLRFVADTSADPVGVPMADHAREYCERAATAAHKAIDAAGTYASTL